MSPHATAEPPTYHTPSCTSPTLTLVPATPRQAHECQLLNADAWRGPLSQPAYLRREEHLASQPATLHGGITHWVLVDTADPDHPDDPTILAACETYRKRAFVGRRRRDGEGDVREVTTHGIGSVFCRDDFRGQGYAGRMMEELAKRLRTWQQEEGEGEAVFNALYSDIGKKFYARRGWVPFPSSHIELRAVKEEGPEEGVTTTTTTTQHQLPTTRLLKATDLPALCEVDVKQLRQSMGKFTGRSSHAKAKVAFLPDADTLQWQHSREEFIAQELVQRHPEAKGALVERGGGRVWCVWTRRLAGGDSPDTTLYITRLVVEGRPDPDEEGTADGASASNGAATGESLVDAIAACLRAAQVEAGRWDIGRVEMWNPAGVALRAAEKLEPGVQVVHREDESIASLLWYGEDVEPSELEWVACEKYAWC